MMGAILLLGLGLALIVAEVLFPSFGLLAVLSTAAIVSAVVLAFRESTGAGILFLVVSVVLVPAVILLTFKLLPMTPLGKRMIATGLSFESAPSMDERDLELVGVLGVVEAPCRPAGIARLDGRRVDVVTRGEWIETGQSVRVVEVSGNRVVVARSAPEESQPNG